MKTEFPARTLEESFSPSWLRLGAAAWPPSPRPHRLQRRSWWSRPAGRRTCRSWSRTGRRWCLRGCSRTISGNSCPTSTNPRTARFLPGRSSQNPLSLPLGRTKLRPPPSRKTQPPSKPCASKCSPCIRPERKKDNRINGKTSATFSLVDLEKLLLVYYLTRIKHRESTFNFILYKSGTNVESTSTNI